MVVYISQVNRVSNYLVRFPFPAGVPRSRPMSWSSGLPVRRSADSMRRSSPESCRVPGARRCSSADIRSQCRLCSPARSAGSRTRMTHAALCSRCKYSPAALARACAAACIPRAQDRAHAPRGIPEHPPSMLLNPAPSRPRCCNKKAASSPKAGYGIVCFRSSPLLFKQSHPDSLVNCLLYAAIDCRK